MMSQLDLTAWPSTEVRMSPTLTPALSAGLPSSTLETMTPSPSGTPKWERSSGVRSVRPMPR